MIDDFNRDLLREGDVPVFDKETQKFVNTQIPGFSEFAPETYGAKGDGVTSDSAAFTAMIAAMPDRGGVVRLQNKTYVFNTAVIWTKPVTIIGEGRNDNLFVNAATLIKTSSATINMWQFPIYNFNIRDMSFENTAATPTAGSAIYVTGPAEKEGPGLDYSSTFTIESCSFNGFYDCIHTEDAYQWIVRDCYIYSPARYGIHVRNITTPDGGDSLITGCYFYPNDRSGVAGVYQVSSGGLKIIGNKFNGSKNNHRFDYSYLSLMDANTVDLLICNNSMEAFLKSAIKFRCASGVAFANIVISDNQISPGINTGFPYIDIDGGVGVYAVSGISCIGNELLGYGPGGIASTDTPVSIINVQTVTNLNAMYGFSALQPAIIATSSNTLNLHNFFTTDSNVGIGVPPLAKFHVRKTTGTFTAAGDEVAVFQNNGATSDNTAVSIISGTAGYGILRFTDSGSVERSQVAFNNTTGDLYMAVGGVKGFQLNALGYAQVTTKLVLPNSIWNLSAEGANRVFYGPSSDTIFGSPANYEWRNVGDTPILKLNGTSANMELPIAGAGIILKSPNGSVRKLLTIDNAGAIVLTTV